MSTKRGRALWRKSVGEKKIEEAEPEAKSCKPRSVPADVSLCQTSPPAASLHRPLRRGPAKSGRKE